MLGAVVLFGWLVQDGIVAWEVVVLLVAMAVVLVVIIRSGGVPDPELEEEVGEFADQGGGVLLEGIGDVALDQDL